MSKIIGLTGGIGCGKTTFSRLFSALGVPVLDADESAHRLCEPHAEGWQAILAQCGKAVIHADNSLNRVALREAVFRDATFKKWLEGCLHPLIFQDIQKQTQHHQEANVPYIIWSIPLLFESHRYLDRIHRVLVIDVPVSVQLERVLKRGVALDTARSIIASQVSRSVRQQRADDLVVNTGTEETVRQIVERLHRFYSRLYP